MSIFYRKILSPNKPVIRANTTVKINVLIKKSLASSYSRKIFEQGLSFWEYQLYAGQTNGLPVTITACKYLGIKDLTTWATSWDQSVGFACDKRLKFFSNFSEWRDSKKVKVSSWYYFLLAYSQFNLSHKFQLSWYTFYL